MSSHGVKHKELVERVFEEPLLYFKPGKIEEGWIVPVIDTKAIAYHLEIGVGTSYIVKYGIMEKLKEKSKKKVTVSLSKGEEKGTVIIRIQQGEDWAEYRPFKLEELKRINSASLLSNAVIRGLMIPTSVITELRNKIRLWINKERARP